MLFYFLIGSKNRESLKEREVNVFIMALGKRTNSSTSTTRTIVKNQLLLLASDNFCIQFAGIFSLSLSYLAYTSKKFLLLHYWMFFVIHWSLVFLCLRIFFINLFVFISFFLFKGSKKWSKLSVVTVNDQIIRWFYGKMLKSQFPTQN